MEFWLKNSDDDKFKLPVNPSTYNITVINKNTEVNVVDLGDINLIGKTGLRGAVLASFFPYRDYDFSVNDNGLTHNEYVKKIEKWRKSGKPIRLIITGTVVNMECTIEAFDYGEQDGTRDIYYTLTLKEYKKIKLKPAKIKKKKKTIVKSAREIKPPKKEKTYTVKAGDCMWAIAKKVYGDGSKYKQIYQANKDLIDGRNKGTGLPKYTIYANQVFKIP